jgi:hypothetical protein
MVSPGAPVNSRLSWIRVLIGSEVVGGPLPNALDGVIVNVYSVSGDKPVNVKKAPLVVIVPVGGDVSIEYKIAVGDRFHARSMVVVVGLLAINPVTASGVEGTVGTL